MPGSSRSITLAGFVYPLLGGMLFIGCKLQPLPEDPFSDSPAPISPYAKPDAATNTAPSSGVALATDEQPRPNVTRPTDTQPTKPAQPAADAIEPQIRAILADLASAGPLDPAAERQLASDLRQTDPTLWPLMVQTFRAGATYRQKAAATGLRVTGANVTATDTAPNATSQSVEAGTEPSIIPPVIPPIGASDLAIRPQAGGTPGLTLPTQAILNAATAEAQRSQLESAPQATAAVSSPSATNEPAADSGLSTTKPSPSTAVDRDWEASIDQAIAALESTTREPPHSAADVSRHAWLRMLYLAAGRRDDALKPIAGISAAEQDFWTSQIYALATYLDTERVTDPARRSAEARGHLAKAESRLAEASTLTVRNLAFCTEVSSYGVYDRFKENTFKPGDPLILYAEVENFRSEQVAKGYHTALRSSYQILDAQGRRVAENDLALTEEYCQNERRDYFIRYFLSVPERIYEGKYVLQLTIVDTLSQKIGQSTIDFTVGPTK